MMTDKNDGFMYQSLKHKIELSKRILLRIVNEFCKEEIFQTSKSFQHIQKAGHELGIIYAA